MTKKLTLHISVPDDSYNNALTVFDVWEFLLNNKNPNLAFVGMPVIKDLKIHVVGEEIRPVVNQENIAGLIQPLNANIIMVKPNA